MPNLLLALALWQGLAQAEPAEALAVPASPTVAVIHAPVLPQDALPAWTLRDYQLTPFKERSLTGSLDLGSSASGSNATVSGSWWGQENGFGQLALTAAKQGALVSLARDSTWRVGANVMGNGQKSAYSTEDMSSWTFHQNRQSTVTESQFGELRLYRREAFYWGAWQVGTDLDASMNGRNTQRREEYHDLWRPLGSEGVADDRWTVYTFTDRSWDADLGLWTGWGRRVEARFAWSAMNLLKELAGLGRLAKPATGAQAQELAALFSTFQQSSSWDARARAEAETESLWAYLAGQGLVAPEDPIALLRVADLRGAGAPLARRRGTELTLRWDQKLIQAQTSRDQETVRLRRDPVETRDWFVQRDSAEPAALYYWNVALAGSYSLPLDLAWQLDATLSAGLADGPRSYAFSFTNPNKVSALQEWRQDLDLSLGWQPSSRFDASAQLQLSHWTAQMRHEQLSDGSPTRAYDLQAWRELMGLRLNYHMTLATTLFLLATAQASQDYITGLWVSGAPAPDPQVVAYDRGRAGAPDESLSHYLTLGMAYRFY